MLNIKKTAVAVLAFGNSALFAGSMGPVCNGVNTTIPCEAKAWDFGAQALYLQPSLGANNLVATHIEPNGSIQYDNADPNYSWGFKVEGSYHFNTGNDVNLNWSRVEKPTSNTFSGEDFGLSGIGITSVSSNSSIKPSWNAANFEFGQRVNFGDMKIIRLHGGVAYARVASEVVYSGTAVIAGTPFASNGKLSTIYNGFGPRVGADMAYSWSHGLGMYAHLASALLVGKQGFSDSNHVGTFAIPGRSGSTTAVVPEIEAKLGATYTYAMAQGDLTLNAGWMWIDYIHANLYDTYDAGVSSSAGATTEDFALQGPYVGLKWVGNII